MTRTQTLRLKLSDLLVKLSILIVKLANLVYPRNIWDGLSESERAEMISTVLDVFPEER